MPPPCAQTTVPASSAVSPFPQHRGCPSAPAEEAPPPVPARRGHRAQLSSPRGPRRPALRSVRPLAVLAPGSPAGLGRPGAHLRPARVCRSSWESSGRVTGVSLRATPPVLRSPVRDVPLKASLLACCSGRGSVPCTPHPALHAPIPQSRDRHPSQHQDRPRVPSRGRGPLPSVPVAPAGRGPAVAFSLRLLRSLCIHHAPARSALMVPWALPGRVAWSSPSAASSPDPAWTGGRLAAPVFRHLFKNSWFGFLRTVHLKTCLFHPQHE